MYRFSKTKMNKYKIWLNTALSPFSVVRRHCQNVSSYRSLGSTLISQPSGLRTHSIIPLYIYIVICLYYSYIDRFYILCCGRPVISLWPITMVRLTRRLRIFLYNIVELYSTYSLGHYNIFRLYKGKCIFVRKGLHVPFPLDTSHCSWNGTCI